MNVAITWYYVEWLWILTQVFVACHLPGLQIKHIETKILLLTATLGSRLIY